MADAGVANHETNKKVSRRIFIANLRGGTYQIIREAAAQIGAMRLVFKSFESI
jgi:hypothetical protein